eukprot:m.48534 g.48534  ORF g.48534 m.48534 type:complete len:58 (-) comp20770_c1_seq1:91-264(-)
MPSPPLAFFTEAEVSPNPGVSINASPSCTACVVDFGKCCKSEFYHHQCTRGATNGEV